MYFLELSERYTTQAWYFVLRGMVSVVFGLIVLLYADPAIDALVIVFAAWLVTNSLIQIAPILVGKTNRRLWPQALGSSLLGLAAGLVALISDKVALNTAAFALGGLLIFRAGLQVVVFVEAPMRARHQRLLLASALLSLAAGIIVFTSPFEDDYAFEKLLGIYAIVNGGVHMIGAWRISEQIETSEEHAHTLISQSRLVPIVEEASLAPGLGAARDPQPDHSCRWVAAVPGSRLALDKYRRPIILAPHPDDLEAFAGGLVYKLKGASLSVVFAGGDKGVWSQRYAAMDKTAYIHLRLDESAQAAQLLGVAEIIYLGYLDRGVICTEDAILKVLDILEWYQPDLVVSFEYYQRATPYPHPDHLAAGNIVRHALARYERAGCLDFLVTSTLIPNVFIDVSGVRRVKLEALACHTTQTGLNGIIFPFLEKLTTKLWGAFIGVDFAEGYRLVNIPAMRKKLTHAARRRS